MSAEILEPEALPPEVTAQPVWRSALATLGARALDLPSRYGFHLLVAWRLGVLGAGAFYIVFSVLTLAAGAGRIGIDRALTRDIARALAVGDTARARHLVRHGLTLVLTMSLAVTVVILLAAPALGAIFFHRADYAFPIRLAALAIPPLCLSAAAAGALAGFHRVATSQMIYSWLWPAIFCGFAVVAPLDLERAVTLVGIATWLTALLSFALLWRVLPAKSAHADHENLRLLPLGWSLFSTEVVQLVIAALPALVLGIVATEAAVGVFALTWRLALVINLLVVAVAAMASPRFADQAVRGDAAGLRRTAADAVGLVLGLGIVPLAILAVAAPVLLGLFGAGFASGATTLRILLIGQAITMLATATPELLGMAGHERAMQRVNTISILLFVPVLVLCARGLGSDGAAIAILFVSLINALGATLLARRRLGFVPLSALYRRLRRIREPAHGA